MSLGWTVVRAVPVHDGGMKTIMKLDDLTTIGQLTDFLSGTQAVAFSVISEKDACYLWLQKELAKFRYRVLPRRAKGVVIRYLMPTPPRP